MGPIDPDGTGDTKAIVAASPSSGSSSLNVAAHDEMTTITITGVDGSHVANNGAATTAPSAPLSSLVQALTTAATSTTTTTTTSSSLTTNNNANVAAAAAAPTTNNASTAPTSGYSSVYMNNRNYNIQLGGRTSRQEMSHSRPFPFPSLFLLLFFWFFDGLTFPFWSTMIVRLEGKGKKEEKK